MTGTTKWQADSKNLKGFSVQYWRNGVMLTGRLDMATARAMVDKGRAYVISSQAIGLLEHGQRAG